MYNNLVAPTIQTKRFVVRLIDPIDAHDLFEICNDKEVTKYLTFEPYHFYGDAKRVITNMIRAYYQEECINYAIIEKISNKMIASISITFVKSSNSAEIGYLVNRMFWNNQIISEVMPDILKLCFNYYGLSFVFAKTTTDNIKSAHILEKFNFVNKYTYYKNVKIHNEFKDVYYFELTHDDYIKNGL